MSAEKQSLTLTYTPIVGGDGESRWIRLEQEEPEDETLSMEEAAAIIDELYGIEPCDDGMGGGGEEADPENEPDEEEFDEAMAEMLRRAGICKQPKWWEGVVRVYRSHKRPGYVLRSETAEVRKTEPARESHRQEVDASGAVIELEMPYDGGLTGIPAGVKWTVRGSTVNLDRQISGHLVLRYNTYYERVTMRVPTKVQPEQWRDGMGRASLNPIDISGKTSGDDATERTELPSASVVAIQGDIAATCEMTPPPVDESVDDETIKKICGRDEDDPPHDKDDPQDCWKTIAHYDRCNCSYSRVNEWEEEISAPCDGAAAGSMLGREEQFDGFTGCDDDGEDLTDPEYYKKHCCKYPPAGIHLPKCKSNWSKYAGGHEIENGPAYWKKRYGENVVLHAVTPEQGYCGDSLREYNVPNRNCCEGVPPLEPHPENPEHIRPGNNYLIRVTGGKNDVLREWSVSGGGVTFEGGATRIRAANSAKIFVDEAVCPQTTIRVDDGCSETEISLQGPDSEGPNLDDEDLTVQPGALIVMGAGGGVSPYMWMVGGGLILEGWSAGGRQAYIRAPRSEDWCVGEVTVVDVCGRSDTCYVRNGKTGKWVQQFGFDQCNPPGAPFEPQNPLAYNGTSKPNGEYYVNYVTSERTETNYTGVCPAPRASWVCQRQGDYVVDVNYEELCAQGAGELGYEYEEGCCKRKSKTTTPGLIRYGVHTTTNHATRLYKWICQAT